MSENPDRGTSTDPPLRLALFLDSVRVSAWVGEVVKKLLTLPAVEIVLVVINGAPRRRPASRVLRALQRPQFYLYRIWSWLDRWRSGGAGRDPFAVVDLSEDLAGIRTRVVRPIQTRFRDRFPDEDSRAIRDLDLDVAIRFGFRIIEGEILSAPKFGVWSFHHGDNHHNRGGPPGFWEVMRGEPITGSTLQVLNEDLDGGTVIGRTFSHTHQTSVARNRIGYYWKTAKLLERAIQRLWSQRSLEPEYDPLPTHSAGILRTPANSEMAVALLKWGGRSIARLGASLRWAEQWALGVHLSTEPAGGLTKLHRLKVLVPPRDRFWADPFPMLHDGRRYVFFEEYLYTRGKAHISVMEIGDSGEPGEPQVVLSGPGHLSYPHVFAHDGELYLVPESADMGRVDLYRCESFPNKWVFQKTLLESAERPVDATLCEHSGHWWMFVNLASEGISPNDELYIFVADSLFGSWRPTSQGPAVSDVRTARPAGCLFYHRGLLIRPSQDCGKRYGYGVNFNAVECLEPTRYRERRIASIYPDWDRQVVGIHTVNMAGDMLVVDLMRRIPRWRGRHR